MAILHAGQRLGAYEVEGLLGRGGMAEVYRGTHLTLERPAAIKVLDPKFNQDPTFLLRFVREARAVAKLSHPHIITIYDYGEAGEIAYLVMQLAPGGTLRDRARELTTLAGVVEAIADVGEALAYAHGLGITHRDVKPINVLVGEQQQLLLADFGLARVASESLDLSVSEESEVVGTPYYMAPEQAMGEYVDQRADIYALGIMTFELLTGSVPYRGASMAVLHQHLIAPPPSVLAELPDAPLVLDAAVKRATAKKAEDRYESVLDFVQELRRAAAAAPAMPVRTLGAGRGAASTSQTAGSGSAAAASVQFESASRAASEGSAGFTPMPMQRRPPIADSGAQPGAQFVAMPSSGAGMAAGRRGRRASSFTELQWLTIGAIAVAVLFVNGIGLWLAHAAGARGTGNAARDVTHYIYDHLGTFKSLLTLFALALAALAVLSMRRAVVEEHHLSPSTYRALRRYHRLVGYGAIVIALAIGFLTCVGIFGFGTYSARAVLHSLLGIGLLTLIVVKLAVVRYFPAQRRHLKMLGEGLLLMFVLVVGSSTVPFFWGKLTGSTSKPSGPYSNPYGRTYPALPAQQPVVQQPPAAQPGR